MRTETPTEGWHTMTEQTNDLGLIIAREAARERDPRHNRPHPNRAQPVDLTDVHEKLAALEARHGPDTRTTWITPVRVLNAEMAKAWRVDADQLHIAVVLELRLRQRVTIELVGPYPSPTCAGQYTFEQDRHWIRLVAQGPLANAPIAEISRRIWHELVHAAQAEAVGSYETFKAQYYDPSRANGWANSSYEQQCEQLAGEHATRRLLVTRRDQ
jgi:hypothetical protein